MVASLTRVFGVHNLDLAEDVVQEAFCRALEVWKLRGIPPNPSAWLMRTARNRAIDVLRRERTARTFEPKLQRLFASEWTLVPAVDELLAPAAIKDDQLRMMFSCCHPRLPEPAQIALVLHLVCGFSAAEIGSAFLSSRAAIEKRLTRAKRTLAASKKLFDLEDRDFGARLNSVHRALYLLFNEGYHSASPSAVVRAELCVEAMRLASLLQSHPQTATPPSLALSALMCLHAARLGARLDGRGNLHSLLDQDRSRWDRRLLKEGETLLERSASGPSVTEYHIEAAIAAVHGRAQRAEDTEWQKIVKLYDKLIVIRPTPVVALNRAIAVGQAEGPKRGLEEIAAIEQRGRLASYPFYHAAQGELELRSGRNDAACKHYENALRLARNAEEREFFSRRIAATNAVQAVH